MVEVQLIALPFERICNAVGLLVDSDSFWGMRLRKTQLVVKSGHFEDPSALFNSVSYFSMKGCGKQAAAGRSFGGGGHTQFLRCRKWLSCRWRDVPTEGAGIS